jgi:Ca2+/Na+ antiporter
MRRIVFYPFILLASLILIGTFSILPSIINGGLSSMAGGIVLVGLILIIDVFLFIIYEIKHKNLDQSLLMKVNKIYRNIIILLLVATILLVLFFDTSLSERAYFAFLYGSPYLVVLFLIFLHKKLINVSLSKAHYFNILSTFLVIGGITFCVVLFSNFWHLVKSQF